jgi:hypothetical protein
MTGMLTGKEERANIKGTIKKQVLAETVTRKITKVIDTFIPRGNFNSAYASENVEDFKIETVETRAIRRQFNGIGDRFGVKKLKIAGVRVGSVVMNDRGYSVRFVFPPRFMEFVTLLDNNFDKLFKWVRRHHQQQVHDRTLFDMFQFEFDERTINRRGFFATQDGDSLDIETDLKPDDIVQITFNPGYEQRGRWDAPYAFTMRILRIVKFIEAPAITVNPGKEEIDAPAENKKEVEYEVDF